MTFRFFLSTEPSRAKSAIALNIAPRPWKHTEAPFQGESYDERGWLTPGTWDVQGSRVITPFYSLFILAVKTPLPTRGPPFLWQTASEQVSQKRLIPSGSFSSELSRCLVKWLLNSLCLLPSASHCPRGCPWGKEGSDPAIPLPTLREVMRLNRFVFEKGLEALAWKVPQKCKCLQFIACWMEQSWVSLNWNFRVWGWCVTVLVFFWTQSLLCRLRLVPMVVPYPR